LRHAGWYFYPIDSIVEIRTLTQTTRVVTGPNMLIESAAILDKPTVRRSLDRHLLQATGIEPDAAEPHHWLYATAAFTRALVMERWAIARRNKEKLGAK